VVFSRYLDKCLAHTVLHALRTYVSINYSISNPTNQKEEIDKKVNCLYRKYSPFRRNMPVKAGGGYDFTSTAYS
ncbi:MAG TPA: hypothetical protein VGK38_15175, partial [Prolixibacteraceae bacterium]